MPWELLFRLIELLFDPRRRRPVEAVRHESDRPPEAWHGESDRMARSDRPYPGT